jgi:cytochrome c biogenesis protein CcmG, thiol:disulfide interchange protein DsbE
MQLIDSRNAFFAALALGAALWWTGAADAKELRPWGGGATPTLVLKDLDGREHRLADYQGKVVVVNFWATWCEPCRDEMPSFNRLKARFGNAPFAIVAVNLAEGEARIGEFLKKVPVDFPVLLDRDGSVSKAWRARLLPYTVVLDPQQRIRYTALGELDWGAPEVEARLRTLLPAR